MTPDTSASLAHVEQLPIVRDLVSRIESSKLRPLFLAHKDAFMACSAAATRHHNFTHGLVLHTAEVWQAAQAFLKAAPSTVRYDELCDGTQFCLDELFVAVAIHDFAKIAQYQAGENFCWAKLTMICNQETWTLRELARFGITLTDNELVGLLHAEGGYTEFAVDWRPMSVILHAADLWSSQAMAPVWNPAEALNVTCPTCKSPMRSINGKNGAFFGCTRYSAGCRGTRDSSEVPPVGEAFLTWLKKMYPLPPSA